MDFLGALFFWRLCRLYKPSMTSITQMLFAELACTMEECRLNQKHGPIIHDNCLVEGTYPCTCFFLHWICLAAIFDLWSFIVHRFMLILCALPVPWTLDESCFTVVFLNQTTTIIRRNVITCLLPELLSKCGKAMKSIFLNSYVREIANSKRKLVSLLVNKCT